MQDGMTGARAVVPADRLRRRCDPDGLGFQTTADLEPLDGFLGQARALEALSFGAEIERPGFNLFVLGVPGSGRHTAVTSFLGQMAARKPPPRDWVYVNNFDEPQRPLALGLPTGLGPRLREGMAEAVRDLADALPAVFDSDEYRRRRRAIDEAFEERQEKLFADLGARAEARGIAVLRTPVGFALAPMRDGKVVKPEVFNAWPAEERRASQTAIAELQEDLRTVLEETTRLDRTRRREVRELDQEFAAVAVDQALAEVRQAFESDRQVADWIGWARDDMIETAPAMLAGLVTEDGSAQRPRNPDTTPFRRYMVNVLVSGGEAGGASPVVREDNPTLPNLVGRIEHLPQMGTLVTDFMLIRAGALHRANGGYLLIDARKILTEPMAWDALKRALRNGRIEIESLAERLSLMSTVSLEPEPIPFSAKVVLFGERFVYHLLCQLDSDFPEVFKVAVDFDDTAPWTDATVADFARLMAAIARREEMLPFDRTGVARVVEHAGRIAADTQRLSVRLGRIADLMREADHRARAEAAAAVGAGHVAAAEAARLRRLDRPRELSREAVRRGVMLVATDGSAVGQVNGLSVLQLGTYAFGSPNRITARVRLGAGKLVDIERETELGGPIHSKGVMILAGLLTARYAPDWPVSLTASLVFEQSYGGVEGDSASVAEFCALASAIAGIPLRQDLAVTGSLNQYGDVQPIGGVNEKVEGFFEVCAGRGLTGRQGVIVPASNVQHLMLNDETLAACAAGRFTVYAIARVDEALELLTGRPAGERGEDGAFPEGSVNRAIEDRLIWLARRRIALGAESAGAETGRDGGARNDGMVDGGAGRGRHG
jgi:lon-related putative ATP-dependent protease